MTTTKSFRIFKHFSILLVFLVFPLVSHAGLLSLARDLTRLPLDLIRLGIRQADFTAFLNFKVSFHREYSSENDEIDSLVAFSKNLKIINLQNQKYLEGSSRYKDGVGNLTDIDHKKFILTHTGYIGTVEARMIKDVEFPAVDIPDYLNYDDKGLVNKAMYQGYCGACWAFSVTGALEAQLAKKTGKLNKLSEQNLIDCNKDEEEGNWGCKGGNMQLAYDFIKDQGGISPFKSYKYKGKGNFTCKYDRKKSVGKVKNFVELQSGNETQLLLALIHVGPISLAVDASEPSFQHYKGGIYDHKNCSTEPNHAVLLVGYGTDPIEGPYWILKNSWGTKWGENGFFKLPRNRGNFCGIASDASYPVV